MEGDDEGDVADGDEDEGDDEDDEDDEDVVTVVTPRARWCAVDVARVARQSQRIPDSSALVGLVPLGY
ncbi:hypothetical protein FBY26_0265 [Phycicoccus sp. SLBN-51]|nr:hypothetical protein FBY26_0265 [Phycicoccus sp. SLBN-51]